MGNLVSIIEIPTVEFERAKTFYQNILQLNIEEAEMDGTLMGVLPADAGDVNIILVKGPDYAPTTEGALLYLNAGKDLTPFLERIEKNGGQVLLPKTLISDEMGYFAFFIDSEGNKLGLHSAQ